MAETVRDSPAGSEQRGTVVVSSALDERTAPHAIAEATQLLAAPAAGELIVDVSATRFIDSSGIGALVTIHALALDRGTVAIICGVSPSVLSLIDRVGLREVFRIEG